MTVTGIPGRPGYTSMTKNNKKAQYEHKNGYFLYLQCKDRDKAGHPCRQNLSTYLPIKTGIQQFMYRKKKWRDVLV